MHISKLRNLLFISFLFFLGSCFSEPENNRNEIQTAFLGGLGGTGIDGGLGGTGIDGGLGGTGIEGTITGFGSIIVNGVHIEYDQEQTVDNIFGTKTASKLEVGQVVSVEVSVGADNIVARSISERIAVAGKITGIDVENGTLSIGSETVYSLPGAFNLEGLNQGDEISVSGFWSQGNVLATAISRLPNNSISGEEVIYGVDISVKETLNKTGSKRNIDNENLITGGFVYFRRGAVAAPLVVDKILPSIERFERKIVERVVGEPGVSPKRSVTISIGAKKTKLEVDVQNWKKNSFEKERFYKDSLAAAKRELKEAEEKAIKTENSGNNSSKNTNGKNKSSGTQNTSSNSGGGNSGGGNSGGGNSGGGNSGGGNSGGGNSGGGNSGSGNSGGGNSGGGNSGGGKNK